jgi:DNA repair protein RecO (recombination protein O)
VNKNYKVEATVLSRKNFGEADKIISIFTKYLGKKTVIAKGIRKISSKRAAHLELFTHISAFLHKGKSMDLVTEVVTLQAFTNIRKSLERITYACIALELVDKMTAENQESQEVFSLLNNFLFTLNLPNIKRHEAIIKLNDFKKNLMVKLGFIDYKTNLNSQALDSKIEEIIERKLQSSDLLAKISQHR